MNNFRLTFTLKQHTPLIHFQHFLPTASLRSTELKSSLDKFIIGEYFSCWSSDSQERLHKIIESKDEEKKGFKNWLKHAKKPTHSAFDYDVEIIYPDKNNKLKTNIDELKNHGFFANQASETSFEDKEIYKVGVLEKEPIMLIIKSSHKELLDKIDEILAKFFLLKNFGTRQSKGFGNFFPIEKYDFLNTQLILPYYFDYDKEKLEYYNQYNKIKSYSLFQVINMFYNTLRSGINHRIYFKSLMWAYAKSKGEHWDKKTIKNRYLSIIQNREINKWKNNSNEFRNNPSNFPLGYTDNNKEHHLWRDLLGLSSYEKAGSWKLKKEHIKEEITRFKSPIIFKPFQVGKNKYRVFFGVNPAIKEQFKKGSKKNSESEILGEEFSVKYQNRSGLKLKYLETFDYDNFLKFAIDTYNKKWVEKKFHYKNEFKIIDAIYYQLKTQLKNEK